MIRSFADRDTEQIYNGERSRKLPPNIQRSAQHKLRILSNAATPETLWVPPGNHFETLMVGRASIASASTANGASPSPGRTAPRM